MRTFSCTLTGRYTHPRGAVGLLTAFIFFSLSIQRYSNISPVPRPTLARKLTFSVKQSFCKVAANTSVPSSHKTCPHSEGLETLIGSHNESFAAGHTNTNTDEALGHILMRFHGNLDWDHVACPSICLVPTSVAFVIFFTTG